LIAGLIGLVGIDLAPRGTFLNMQCTLEKRDHNLYNKNLCPKDPDFGAFPATIS
jgi:hypothetical protein